MINRQYQPQPPLTQAQQPYQQQYVQPYPAPIGKEYMFNKQITVKPTWSLAWGLLWRMWVCCIPVYLIILILQLALK